MGIGIGGDDDRGLQQVSVPRVCRDLNSDTPAYRQVYSSDISVLTGSSLSASHVEIVLYNCGNETRSPLRIALSAISDPGRRL